MSDNQAEADTQDSTVADPLDAANSTNSGTNELDAYEASVQAALNAGGDDEEQGEQPADVENDGDNEFADAFFNEENEEQVEELSNEEEEEPEAKAKDRFRFKNAEDQAVAAIAKGRGVSLVEAARIYAGDPAPSQRQEAVEAEAYQEPAETASSVQARIDELEELEAEASVLMEFETANAHRKEAKKLLASLMDLKIAEVQSKANAEQKAAQAFDSQFHATKDKFIGFYPDAASAFNGSREQTPMAKEILRLDAEMRTAGDPIYSHPDKAEVLIKQAAYNLKIPMNKPSSTAKKTVQHRPIQPASGNARTATTDPAKRAADVIAGIRTSDDFERLVASM